MHCIGVCGGRKRRSNIRGNRRGNRRTMRGGQATSIKGCYEGGRRRRTMMGGQEVTMFNHPEYDGGRRRRTMRGGLGFRPHPW